MENEASNRIQHELISQLVFLRLSGILYACDHNNFPRMLNLEARTTATSLTALMSFTFLLLALLYYVIMTSFKCRLRSLWRAMKMVTSGASSIDSRRWRCARRTFEVPGLFDHFK